LPGPLRDPPLRADLLVGHEAEVIRGLEGAFERHRDLIVRVLEDLDRRPQGLSLGRLTARLDEAPEATRRAVEEVLARTGAAIAGDLERLAGHRDPVVRGRALAVLAKVDDARSEAALARGLTDPSDTVRHAAMDAVAVYVSIHGAGGAKLVALLAERLDAGDWQDRRHAARVMGALGSHADEAALLAALADATAYVRQEATRALGRLGQRSSLDGLLAVSADPIDQVRAAAAVALGAIGGPRARARLAEMAAGDPDETVRRAAGAAAGKK
jgi:HEAT repeat protein